jgi:hypothetical protein
MSPGLQDLVRQQAWFIQEMSPEKLALLTQIAACEQAAKAKGEPKAAMDVLQFASEQGWYADGLDDREARGLAAVFDAYARSFTKQDAPPVGATIANTLRQKSFDVTTLPESGDKVVIVASKDERLGRAALDLSLQFLPQIEALTGKFPYPFIYIEVSPDFPKEILGVSYDEFIGIRSDSVNAETIAHELTHSTVYGFYPIWFEEGLAHFMQYFLTNQVEKGTSLYTSQLNSLRADNRVDIINYGLYTDWDYIAERARGFLFLKSIYDIEGIEGLSKTVKSLRSKSYNDNELLTAIMQLAPDSAQTALRKLYCDRIVGATRTYCTAGS